MGYKLNMEKANKAQIVEEIVEKTGISRKETEACLDSFFDIVKQRMLIGKQVNIKEFGVFLSKKRATKIGRNIKKNTAMVIDAHYTPGFKPSKSLVDQIKKSPALVSMIAQEEKSKSIKK